MFTINQNLVDDFADKINEKEKKNNKVTSLSSSSTHIQYPSAKAVYDAISEVEANSGGNYIDDYYFDTTTKDIVLDFTSSGSGGGNGGGSSVDIVTSWEQTLSDEKVPSEKLVKDTIDDKISKSQTVGLVKNDGSIDTNTYLTSHQDITGKEDTSNKLTSLQSLNDLSTDTQYPSAKLVYTYWSDLDDRLLNNYPLSIDLGAVAFSNDYEDLRNLPTFGDLAYENDVDLEGHDLDELSDNTNLLFSGDYDDLDNKPTIPTATSDLTNDGSSSSDSLVYVETSATSGLLKNDGSVMTGGTGSNNYAIGNHTHSGYLTEMKIGSTSGLPVKTTTNGVLTTGSFGTTSGTFAEGNHTHSAYVNPTIADNLTTDSSSQVLSAKQGKVLNEKIGNIISIINGTGS